MGLGPWICVWYEQRASTDGPQVGAVMQPGSQVWRKVVAA